MKNILYDLKDSIVTLFYKKCVSADKNEMKATIITVNNCR